MTVHDATEAFGSDLRVNLIRHYRTSPGPQRSAVEALGANSQAVSHNTRILVASGVVVVEDSDDKRSPVCRVDEVRLRELIEALGTFTAGSASE